MTEKTDLYRTANLALAWVEHARQFEGLDVERKWHLAVAAEALGMIKFLEAEE